MCMITNCAIAGQPLLMCGSEIRREKKKKRTVKSSLELSIIKISGVLKYLTIV